MNERSLQGRTVLIVEDEYMIAEELRLSLEDVGAHVLGPVGSIDAALELADTTLDAAVLDMNLGGVSVLPVAERLGARGIPFVFSTGYDASAMPAAFAHIPRCEKPFSFRALEQVLCRVIDARH